MLEILSERQRQLLRLLLKTKPGLTVDELAKGLEVTRNAVRQHLTALEADGLVAPAATRPSGGRPHQLFALTDKGRELFPRHYNWLAQLLVESVRRDEGAEGLRRRFDAMGTEVGKQLRNQYPALDTRKRKVIKIAEVMGELGYDARTAAPSGGHEVIEADNCPYHNLAKSHPEVCRFDLALMEAFTESRVEHQECMVRGANTCRFKFMPRR
jgi:predicted ArsR family transcriptional regulator